MLTTIERPCSGLSGGQLGGLPVGGGHRSLAAWGVRPICLVTAFSLLFLMFSTCRLRVTTGQGYKYSSTWKTNILAYWSTAPLPVSTSFAFVSRPER